MTAAMTTPPSQDDEIYFVESVSVNSMGRGAGFSRCGLRFEFQTPRPIRVGAVADRSAEVAVVTRRELERILAEAVSKELDKEACRAANLPLGSKSRPVLRARKGTIAELQDFIAGVQAAHTPTAEQQLAVERARNADLEVRLMRLELATQSTGPAPAEGAGGAAPKKAQRP